MTTKTLSSTDNFLTQYRFTVNKEFSKRGLIKVELDSTTKKVAFTRAAEINDLGWSSLPLFNNGVLHAVNPLKNIDLFIMSNDSRSVRHIKFKKVEPLMYSPFTSLSATGKGSLRTCETLICGYRDLEIRDLTTEKDDEYIDLTRINDFIGDEN